MKEKTEVGNSPAEKQDNLRLIFNYLPKKEVVSPTLRNIDKLDEGQAGAHYSEIIKDQNRRMRSELTLRQIDFLNRLLEQARITDVFKDRIRTDFEEFFREGIPQTEAPIIDILGLEEQDINFEGIFSEDETARMDIERDFQQLLFSDLLSVQEQDPMIEGKDYTSLKAEEIALLESRIDVFDIQFTEVYGVPVEMSVYSN